MNNQLKLCKKFKITGEVNRDNLHIIKPGGLLIKTSN